MAMSQYLRKLYLPVASATGTHQSSYNLTDLHPTEGIRYATPFPKWAFCTRRIEKMDARSMRARNLPHSLHIVRFAHSPPPQVSTMKAGSQQPKGREDAIPALDAAIGALNLADRNSRITPAKTAFATVSALLTTIRVHLCSSTTICCGLTSD